MGALPIPVPTAQRYGPYIQELQEFLDTYDLRYGTPADLLPVTARLRAPGPFAGDLGLVLRSILFRERSSLSRSQLLELLALAIGGQEMEHPPQRCWFALSQLYAFVSDLRRRPLSISTGGGQLVPFPTPSIPRLPVGELSSDSVELPGAAAPPELAATAWIFFLCVVLTGALLIALVLVLALRTAPSLTHPRPVPDSAPAIRPKPSPYGEAFVPLGVPIMVERHLVPLKASELNPDMKAAPEADDPQNDDTANPTPQDAADAPPPDPAISGKDPPVVPELQPSPPPATSTDLPPVQP